VITEIEVHAVEQIGREVDYDISAAITWALAFHSCPEGFIH
jgi:hypothetical protein